METVSSRNENHQQQQLPGDDADSRNSSESSKDGRCEDDRSPSSSSVNDQKAKVNLRPSVLRVQDPDSEDSNSASNNRNRVNSSNSSVFNFTPLANVAGVISSSSSTELPKIEVTPSNQNGNSIILEEEEEEKEGIGHSSTVTAASLFSGLAQQSSCSLVTSTTPQSPTTRTASRGGSFVFGENLEARALVPEISSDVSNDASTDAKEADGKLENQEASTSAEKRKFEAITGEEDESKVMQMYCKLYSWESSKGSWKEKGKGMLRLNDKVKDDKTCSRLVMRTSGSLKVILNCTVVLGMKFELSSEQCLRFTNVEGIFLIKGKDKDIDQLHSAVEYRLREMSKRIRSNDKVESDEAKAQNSKVSPESTTPHDYV